MDINKEVLNSLTQHGLFRLKSALNVYYYTNIPNDVLSTHDFTIGLCTKNSVTHAPIPANKVLRNGAMKRFGKNEQNFMVTLLVSHNKKRLFEFVLNPIWDIKEVDSMLHDMKVSNKKVLVQGEYRGYENLVTILYNTLTNIHLNNEEFLTQTIDSEIVKNDLELLPNGSVLTSFEIIIYDNLNDIGRLESLTVRELIEKYPNDTIGFFYSYDRDGSTFNRPVWNDRHDNPISDIVAVYLKANPNAHVTRNNEMSKIGVYDRKEINFRMNGIFNYNDLLQNQMNLNSQIPLTDKVDFNTAIKFSGYNYNKPIDIVYHDKEGMFKNRDSVLQNNINNGGQSISTDPLE